MFDVIQRLIGNVRLIDDLLKEHRLENAVQHVGCRAREELSLLLSFWRRRVDRQVVVHGLIVQKKEIFVEQILSFERFIDGEEIEDELHVAIETIIDGEWNDVVTTGIDMDG